MSQSDALRGKPPEIIMAEPVARDQTPARSQKPSPLRRAAILNTLLFLSLALTHQKLVIAEAGAVSEETIPFSAPRETALGSLPTEEEKKSLERAFRHQQPFSSSSHSSSSSNRRHGNEDEDGNVLVVATVDGTLAGLSRSTGKLLWKQPGIHNKQHPTNKCSASDSSSRTMPDPGASPIEEKEPWLYPLMTTTTTTQSCSDWRTGAVPSMDGTVFLSSSDDTATSSIAELVSRAPFVDSRGRFYVGSRQTTAAALNVQTGDVLQILHPQKSLEQLPMAQNTVWIGRVDHSVSIYDARSGELDVQFSTSEIRSVLDMMVPPSVADDGVLVSLADKQPVSRLIATPSGHVAYRNPDTLEIEWVSEELFETPVAYGIDSAAGTSLGVDVVPDAPIPSSGTSTEYFSRELQRQDDDEESHTIVGALPSGELYAIPLGQRPQRTSAVNSHSPHSITSLAALHNVHSRVPHITGSSESGPTRNHEKEPAAAAKLQSGPTKEGAPSERRQNQLQILNKKKACSPSSSFFPGCLLGKPLDKFTRGISGSFLSESAPPFPVGDDSHYRQNDHAYDDKDAGALARLSYNTEYRHGFVPPDDEFYEAFRRARNRRKYNKMLKILGSWLPPTIALIFVLSFEMGRRKRVKDNRDLDSNVLSDTRGSQAALEMGSFGDVRVLSADGSIKSEGVIQVSDEVLGYGGHGTVVYRGMLEGRKVAVKRMLKAYHASADREISLLIESDGHPNVVRYFLKELRGDFVYLALELCSLSLHDLIATLRNRQDQLGEKNDDVSVSPSTKRILHQIASGVRHLHSLRIVHRDLKPANILLLQAPPGNADSSSRQSDSGSKTNDSIYEAFCRNDYIAKISDMGLGKQLVGQSSFGLSTLADSSLRGQSQGQESNSVGVGPGSVGWQAPEVMSLRWTAESTVRSEEGSSEGSPLDVASSTRTSRSVDIFSLGCIFHSTLVPGCHPFGEWYEREANIMRNRPVTDSLKQQSADAHDLITSMIQRNPSGRPTSKQICEHPVFWNSEKRLTFLCELSDRLENDAIVSDTSGRDASTAFLDYPLAIERNAAQVVGTAWDRVMDENLISNIQRFRTYDTSSVRDFLRLIRNKHHHYDELPADVRAKIGSSPEGLLGYFETRFPKLLMHCFIVCRDLLPPSDPLAVKYAIMQVGKHNFKRLESQLSTISSEAGVPYELAAEPSDGNREPEEPESTLPEQEAESQYRESPPSGSAGDLPQPAKAGTKLITEEKKDESASHDSHSSEASPPSEQNQVEVDIAEDVVVWEGSAAAKSFECRGWIRSDEEWMKPSEVASKKRDDTSNRCEDDPKYRTRLCNHWQDSLGTFCPMRKKNKCIFAHGPAELRVKQSKRNRWGKLVDKNGNNPNLNSSGGEDTYGAAHSIETVRKAEGKWNTNKKLQSRAKKQTSTRKGTRSK